MKIASLVASSAEPRFSFPARIFVHEFRATCKKGREEEKGGDEREREREKIWSPTDERRESSGGKFLRNRLAYKIRFQNLADRLNEKSWLGKGARTYITIIVVIMSSSTVSQDFQVLGNRETVKDEQGPGDKSF